jgi:peptidoglycan/xylan/chitin deacetylase (PgdA/CDA1 family)
MRLMAAVSLPSANERRTSQGRNPPPTHHDPTGNLYAPILMYHHVSPMRSRYAVDAAAFESQMRWLSENGYQSVAIDDIADALQGNSKLPAKPIAITFDDGWRTQLTDAAPIMREYGFRATFYLISTYANGADTRVMSWHDIEMLMSDGHWFGSHSAKHQRETKLADTALAADVISARNEIQKHLGVTATTHAYPYGDVDRRVEGAARAAGYRAAVDVTENKYQTLVRLFRLNRIEVRNSYTLNQFISKMQR